MLGILVVIQSTTGRPPLQLKLSGHRSLIQHALRQSPSTPSGTSSTGWVMSEGEEVVMPLWLDSTQEKNRNLLDSRYSSTLSMAIHRR